MPRLRTTTQGQQVMMQPNSTNPYDPGIYVWKESPLTGVFILKILSEDIGKNGVQQVYD